MRKSESSKKVDRIQDIVLLYIKYYTVILFVDLAAVIPAACWKAVY